MAAAPDFSQMTNPHLHLGGVEANEYPALYENGTVAYDSQSGFGNGHTFDNKVETRPAYPTPNMDTEEEVEAEVFSCDMCNKPFLRPCDLNKHIKTHSRPYKCLDPQCEYYEVGWPTEKEADRHYNDKHAQAPQTFRCRFCTHTSKRHSNLKQHMEKAHGWNYIRSRAMRSYKCSMVGCSDCLSPEESQERHGTTRQITPISAASQHHMTDFILFGGDGMSPSTPVLSGDGLYVQMPHQGMTNSYVPWASPPTRGEDISNCLRSVDSVISHPLLDPRLARPPYAHAAQEYQALPGTVPQYTSPQHPVPNSSLKVSCSPPALTQGNPGWGEVPNISMSKDGQSPGNVPTGRSGGNIGYSPSIAGPQQVTSRGLIRLKEEPNDDDDENDDDDDEPPRKRQRAVSDVDFDDDAMPCPFWRLDPDFFNRNNKEKFSPCHTKHKDISTIVRHLSRPAHYLDVNERSISSFDTPEEERPSPKAGLCRKCWKIFRDRTEFDAHVLRACAKVSKGKREKFFLLSEAFCEGRGVVATGSRRQSTAQDVGLGLPMGNDMELDPVVMEMPAASIVGPAAPEPVAQLADDEDAPVSRSEHRALEAKYKVIKKTLRFILKHLGSGRDTEQGTHAVALHGTTSRVGSSLSALADDLTRQAEVEADRESLVSGMDSRPTDVIRDRFIFEAQRTLSGLSSCSDKSSVRHVPLTPRFEGSEERVAAIKTTVATPLKTTGATYADSGYGGSSTKDKARGVKQSVSSTDLETVQEQREVEAEAAFLGVGGDSQGLSQDYLQEAETTNFEDYWDN